MSAWGYVALIAGFLIVALLAAIRMRGPVRVLVLVQVLYFGMGYVVRAAVLLHVQPAAIKDDPLADPRLALVGYGPGLRAVLPHVLLGVAVFAALVVVESALLARRTRSADDLSVGAGHRPSLNQLWLLLLLGWVGRGAAHATGSTVAETVGNCAAVSAGLAVLVGFTGQTPTTRRRVLAVMVVSELAWSLVDASKAPIFAVGLWFLIALVSPSSGLAVPRRRVLLAAGGVVVSLLLLFPVVQQAKVARGTLTQSPTAYVQYPGWLRPVAPVVARFDLLKSATDATFAGRGSWLTPEQGVRRAAESLVPSQILGSKAGQSGADWAIEVRAQSLPNSDTGVHLADGPIAEGYVIGGSEGTAAEIAVLCGLTVAVGRALRSGSVFLLAGSVMMTAQPFLFERGVLGLFEGVSKSIEVGIIVGVVLSLRSLIVPQSRQHRRARPSVGARPTAPVGHAA